MSSKCLGFSTYCPHVGYDIKVSRARLCRNSGLNVGFSVDISLVSGREDETYIITRSPFQMETEVLYTTTLNVSLSLSLSIWVAESSKMGNSLDLLWLKSPGYTV